MACPFKSCRLCPLRGSFSWRHCDVSVGWFYFHFLFSGTSRGSIRAGLHQCPCVLLYTFASILLDRLETNELLLQHPACNNVTDIVSLNVACYYGVRNQWRSYVT